MRCGRVYFPQVFGHKLNAGGSNVLLDAMPLRSSRNRNNPRLLSKQPCERNLRWSGVLPSGDTAEQLDERNISFSRFGREPWNEIAEVGALKPGVLIDFPGEESRTQWAEWNEANPKLLACR